MRKLLIFALLVAVVYNAVRLWESYVPITHPAGVLITREPEQSNLQPPQSVKTLKGWTLMPLALYEIDARVLSIKHYTDDSTAELAPYDLAVGWQKMSDTSVLQKLDIWQSNRFYKWQYWAVPPIPENEIITQSANMHIIPADDEVLVALKKLRKGSLLHMKGYLVEATHPRADKPWRSSLRRDDTGEGACEIMLVQQLTVNE